MPPPPSTKAALEKWLNDLAPETNDEHDPYCFMYTINEDGSCFVAGFTTPNLIRNARRRRGEDYLSIDGQFSITVEGFTMQIVGTCDRAHHLLPLAVCVATAECKEVVRPFLAALRAEVEKDSMPWVPTKGMADHADGFRNELGGTQPAWPECMCTDSSAQRTGIFLHWATYAERSFERIIHNVSIL